MADAQWAYDRDHARVPSRVIVATETFPARSVEEFQYANARPYVVGNFIWTAMDYMGESSIGAAGHYTPSALACGTYCAQPFPWHLSSCGDLDIMGDIRPQGRLRRVLWGVSPLALSVQRPGVEVIGAWGYRDEQQTVRPPQCLRQSWQPLSPPLPLPFAHQAPPHWLTDGRWQMLMPAAPLALPFRSGLGLVWSHRRARRR